MQAMTPGVVVVLEGNAREQQSLCLTFLRVGAGKVSKLQRRSFAGSGAPMINRVVIMQFGTPCQPQADGLGMGRLLNRQLP